MGELRRCVEEVSVAQDGDATTTPDDDEMVVPLTVDTDMDGRVLPSTPMPTPSRCWFASARRLAAVRRRRPSTAVRLERQRDSAITATSRGCRRSSGSVGLGERNAVQLGERLELGPQPPPPHVAARFGAAASPVFRKEL
uniref:Uncharacterized protein n=1 Tax=Oryza sativa subsp. japonica TaxID=39947 RepID=Q6Z571_ORYSJ|nr:hypothetical protein [Oryza sativa Japonica Group]